MDIFQHPETGEIARYLVSGCSAVLTDMVMYWFFLPVLGPTGAKALSFITGTVVSYNLNKHWTWKQRKHSWTEVSRFATLYGCTLVSNLLVNNFFLSPPLDPYYLPIQLLMTRYQFGWLFATGTSTVINYIGQKYWVFKKAPEPKQRTGTDSLSEPGSSSSAADA